MNAAVSSLVSGIKVSRIGTGNPALGTESPMSEVKRRRIRAGATGINAAPPVMSVLVPENENAFLGTGAMEMGIPSMMGTYNVVISTRAKDPGEWCLSHAHCSGPIGGFPFRGLYPH